MTKVAVLRHGIETGSSQVLLQEEGQGIAIDRQIRRIRNAVFEEELFHEINREARLIANQGVRTQSRVVEASIGAHTQIRVTQLNLDYDGHALSGGPDNDLAESIALNLRLLLLLEHKHAKVRRSTSPPVMSLTPLVSREYALLRPVLANLRHQASIAALSQVCKAFKITSAVAGLEFMYETANVPRIEKDDDMQRFREPVRSTLTTQLQSGRTILIDVETYLGSPIYGTVFRSHDINFEFTNFQAGTFHTVEEATEYLARALTLELMSQTAAFEVLRPHSGEVMLKMPGQVTAMVNFRPQCITLLVTGSDRAAYGWRPSGFQRRPAADNEISGSFVEVVSSLTTKG